MKDKRFSLNPNKQNLNMTNMMKVLNGAYIQTTKTNLPRYTTN